MASASETSELDDDGVGAGRSYVGRRAAAHGDGEELEPEDRPAPLLLVGGADLGRRGRGQLEPHARVERHRPEVDDRGRVDLDVVSTDDVESTFDVVVTGARATFESVFTVFSPASVVVVPPARVRFMPSSPARVLVTSAVTSLLTAPLRFVLML